MSGKTETTIESLAARSVERHPSDRDAAVRCFVALLHKHPDLYQSAFLRLGSFLVGEMARALHFTNVRAEVLRHSVMVREKLGGVLHSWSLSQGKLLVNANALDLKFEIDRLKSQRHGIDIKIRFLVTLADRLVTANQQVGDVWTEREIFALCQSEGLING